MSLFVKRYSTFFFLNFLNTNCKQNRKSVARIQDTKNKRKSERPISICKLNMSPCLHTRPINLVVYKGS